MKNKSFDAQKKAIMAVYPDATNIMPPVVTGAQNNVLMANTPDGDMVFKFNDAKLVDKNVAVSKLYKMREIPVQQLVAHDIDDIYFEQYKKIPGKTLFEAIQDGMSAEQIKQVYYEILVEFEKMSKISPAYINKNLTRMVHDIARINVSNANNKLMGGLCTIIVYLANISKESNKALCHSDITPKNVIVSDDGHLVGFIDIDNVCVCDTNHAFGMMAAKYHELGLNVDELINEYHKISGKRMPRNEILCRVKIANIGKKLLWQHATKKHRQK